MVEGKPKVLIVDDEPGTREILRRVNNYFGYQTIEAENGEEGWALYQESKPNLTISDIYMPKLNGLQLLSNIKKQDEAAKVILITGYSHYRTLMQTSRYGADGYLEKPFDIEELARVMSALTNDPTPEQGSSDENVPKRETAASEATPENVAPAEEPERDG
ncbi:MAG: response regulator [bacterium]